VSKELLKVNVICVDTPFQSFFDIDLSPCHASTQAISQQRADAAGTDDVGRYAFCAVPLRLVNSWEIHSNNFSLARKII